MKNLNIKVINNIEKIRSSLITCILIIGFYSFLSSQSFDLDLTVQIDPSLLEQFNEDGRLFIFLNQNPNVEPRNLLWPSPGNYVFAKNISDWDPSTSLNIVYSHGWIGTVGWNMDEIPKGTYYIQLLWDQDRKESRINAPGNIFLDKQKVILDGDKSLELVLNKVIGNRELINHELVRWVNMESKILSDWWGNPVSLKAGVLLPAGYTDGDVYAIRYNVAGYGGRYTRLNNLVKNPSFLDWWTSDEAPPIINVFLDGEGPFGDSYQMDSENSGPYGEALINELIPHIENLYRGTSDSQTRFVDGCSTGGWVSLGLQLYYPDVFNGVFSYSPDAIDFENYQLINIYKDKNAYTNEFGYERPVARMTDGEPWIPLKDFIQYENVLGDSDTYLNSGMQFSAHTALYSPRGEDGLPKPLFHPSTGDIDTTVAQHWKKYDFKIFLDENWDKLVPKLNGKIYIWMGDMDQFYLNMATRSFHEYLKSKENPIHAKIEFGATQGHCAEFSNRTVLQQIADRLTEIK